ncbi:G-protein coupled receptor family C group 6 member A-like [Cheilinus undulatus]|uniref:G-protein coupled receptor family C group 6 member A-like n=1 Tax=Cheilinus undulatus TaxID=241271 RepID=UPI001BD1DB80|nr:G-protein coupled receptor family C group 6 member A-like [Cheilinus undulatus]
MNSSEDRACNRFTVARLVQSLIMVQTVEEINKSGELGNLTLGYHIVDSCADVTTALKNAMSFMKRNTADPSMDGEKKPSPPVLAVIGGYYSEISIAVTRLLNLENIPQVSYGSTCGQLCDKTRFPSFMRTVPEDDHQVRAIISILTRNQWTWVGLVATDSEAGRYAVERLQEHGKNNNICFAFISILPEVLVDKSLEDCISDTVKSITENRNVNVIVSFAKAYHMLDLFRSLLKDPRGRGKVWIASDNWSESTKVLGEWSLSDVGTVFGIIFKSGNTERYREYLQNLDVDPDHHKNNTFLSKYLKIKQKEQARGETGKPNANASEGLVQKIYPSGVNVELAVRAIAKAVADLCVNRDCRTTQRLQPLELRVAMREAKFDMDGKTYMFDRRGDLNIGYDVIQWKQTSPSQLDVHYIIADAAECHPCNTTTEYSSLGRDRCLRKMVVFMKWDDIYHEILLAFTALGALLTVIVGIIFLAHWNTPVVRASVGPICLLLLFSLFFTFASVTLFGGKPKLWQCQAQQVVFGLSFTLCISCIMVKSFKIILAFEFDPSVKRVLKKLYKPYIIIALCFLGQVLICALWLALKSPEPELDKTAERTERLYTCNETSLVAFGAMLSYIGLLALICFGIAFKGRKLPQSYNDAKFITFSMLIYFICWIIFGPVYVSFKNQYCPAVEMVVILISAYGILFCQFITKCYIILFKQKANTKSAFLRDVRNFSLGSVKDEKDGDFVSPSLSLEGIQNPALDVEPPVIDPPRCQSQHSSSDVLPCSLP